MSKRKKGNIIATEQTAAELGMASASIDLAGEHLLESAVGSTALAAATTSQFCESVQKLREATSARIQAIAKDGSESAKEYASEWESNIATKISEMATSTKENLEENGAAFVPELEKITDKTGTILEKGMELAKQKEISDKEKEEMSKQMKMMMMALATLFFMHFGMSMQTMAIAGIAFKLLSNKDKSLVEKGKEFSSKLLHDKEYRHLVGDKAIGIAEACNPSIAGLNLRDKALALEGTAEFIASKVQLTHQISKMTPSEMKSKVAEGMLIVASESLDRNPELKARVAASLDKALQTTDLEAKAKAIKASAGNIAEATENMMSFAQEVNKTIFVMEQNLVDPNSPHKLVNVAERELVKQTADQMREYVKEKQTKYVTAFCKEASRAENKAAAATLGFTKETTTRLNAVSAALEGKSYQGRS